MNSKKLIKALNQDALIIIKVKTLRRLVKYLTDGSTLDSTINDLMDCDDFNNDQDNKK